ncbi:MAG: ABC transporter substrate-binding protein, partial [Bacillati bacterium ANGP1]
MRTGLAVAMAAVMLLTMSGLGTGQEPVTITYWQYFFQSKVTLVDEL